MHIAIDAHDDHCCGMNPLFANISIEFIIIYVREGSPLYLSLTLLFYEIPRSPLKGDKVIIGTNIIRQ